jgi:DNA-binding MarR family transcriptional regulator
MPPRLGGSFTLTRREIITALMDDDPSRPWRGRELADQLGIKRRNMLTQLAEWTRLGFLIRTHAGTYMRPTRRDDASP